MSVLIKKIKAKFNTIKLKYQVIFNIRGLKICVERNKLLLVRQIIFILSIMFGNKCLKSNLIFNRKLFFFEIK